MLCFVSTLFSPRFVISGAENDINGYLLCRSAVQFISFLIPSVLFLQLTNRNFFRNRAYGANAVQNIFLTLCITLLLISLSSLFLIVNSDLSAQSPIGISGPSDILKILLIYCLTPAFCEELVFRGLIMPALKKYGALYSILYSSLVFAAVHFSLSEFTLYLMGGILLGICSYVTGSFWFSAAAHFLYNFYTVFFSPGIQNAIYSVSVPFYILVFGVLFLIALILLFYVCESVFFAASAKKSIINKRSPNSLSSQFKYVVTSPSAIFCVIFCLIYAISHDT